MIQKTHSKPCNDAISCQVLWTYRNKSNSNGGDTNFTNILRCTYVRGRVSPAAFHKLHIESVSKHLNQDLSFYFILTKFKWNH